MRLKMSVVQCKTKRFSLFLSPRVTLLQAAVTRMLRMCAATDVGVNNVGGLIWV